MCCMYSYRTEEEEEECKTKNAVFRPTRSQEVFLHFYTAELTTSWRRMYGTFGLRLCWFDQ